MEIMAVCDRENEFSGALARVGSQLMGFPLQVVAFTDPAVLKDFVSRRSPCLVLLGESLYQPGEWTDYSGRLVLLGNGVDTGDELPHLYKYQSGEDILRKALGYCREDATDYRLREKAHFRSYGIYTPRGETDRDAFSGGFARALAAREKVLFLDLTSWSLWEESENQNLSDLLYYVGERKDGLLPRLEQLVRQRDGVCVTPGVRHPADLLCLNSEDWRFLFQKLKAESGYTAVVANVGPCIQPVEEFLQHCDRICVPQRDTPDNRRVWERVIEEIRKSPFRDILSRTRQILMGENEDAYSKGYGLGEEETAYIETEMM